MNYHPHKPAPKPRGQVVVSYDDLKEGEGIWMDDLAEPLMLVSEPRLDRQGAFSNTWRFLGRGGIELEFQMDSAAAERMIENLIDFLERPENNSKDTYRRIRNLKYRREW
jgi:hypothetical protein